MAVATTASMDATMYPGHTGPAAPVVAPMVSSAACPLTLASGATCRLVGLNHCECMNAMTGQIVMYAIS